VTFEIRPEELQRRLQAGERIYLLDVRQEWEHQAARLDEVQPEPGQLLVAYCHHGVRSLSAAAILRNAGHSNAVSLAGGIDLWSRAIDPSVPEY
jgi:rhodanese-related sulfurtransferase